VNQPIAIIGAAAVIDNPWTLCILKAKEAGALLADALLERATHGDMRPVTLVGYSCGASVVFAALEALAAKGDEGAGVVESVLLAGAPTSADAARWEAAQGVVSGRFVNAYSKKDWILKVLHRSLHESMPAGLQVKNIYTRIQAANSLSKSLLLTLGSCRRCRATLWRTST